MCAINSGNMLLHSTGDLSISPSIDAESSRSGKAAKYLCCVGQACSADAAREGLKSFEMVPHLSCGRLRNMISAVASQGNKSRHF